MGEGIEIGLPFVCYADVGENDYFRGKLKSFRRYHSSKNKIRYGTGLTQG